MPVYDTPSVCTGSLSPLPPLHSVLVWHYMYTVPLLESPISLWAPWDRGLCIVHLGIPRIHKLGWETFGEWINVLYKGMSKHLSRPFDPQSTKVISPTFLNSYKNYCLAFDIHMQTCAISWVVVLSYNLNILLLLNISHGDLCLVFTTILWAHSFVQ